MLYRFTCKTCRLHWEMDTDAPQTSVCLRCKRKGVASSVFYRKKRSDAKKAGPGLAVANLNIHTRPVRTPVPKRAFDGTGKDADSKESKRIAAAVDDDDDDDDDEIKDGGDSKEDDPEYVPAPPFSIEMRYSAGGSFEMARVVGVGTTKKSKPWTRITAAAGRGDTAAQFGNVAAHDYGHREAPGYAGQATGRTWDYEWCHLIADSLGGPTAADNLFCGTFHANTAMLCIEDVLRGKTHLEVQVEIDVRTGTHLGEKITYSVRRAGGATRKKKRLKPQPLEIVIDALATGCTKEHGTRLSGVVRAWLKKN